MFGEWCPRLADQNASRILIKDPLKATTWNKHMRDLLGLKTQIEIEGNSTCQWWWQFEFRTTNFPSVIAGPWLMTPEEMSYDEMTHDVANTQTMNQHWEVELRQRIFFARSQSSVWKRSCHIPVG